jgi:hypothetical protein
MSEAHLFRGVEAEKTISILIGTSFPGMVGMREVDLQLALVFHGFVVAHLDTVVKGYVFYGTYLELERSSASLQPQSS